MIPKLVELAETGSQKSVWATLDSGVPYTVPNATDEAAYPTERFLTSLLCEIPADYTAADWVRIVSPHASET